MKLSDAAREKREEFKDFYREYFLSGLKYALSFKLSMPDAQDIVHHCFELAWKRFDEYREAKNQKYWFLNIVHNKVKYETRKKAKLQSRVIPINIESIPGMNSINPEVDFLKKDKVLKIQMMVDELPENYREVFKQRLAGVSYPEIARNSGITVKAAQRRMERAIHIAKDSFRDLIREILYE